MHNEINVCMGGKGGPGADLNHSYYSGENAPYIEFSVASNNSLYNLYMIHIMQVSRATETSYLWDIK